MKQVFLQTGNVVVKEVPTPLLEDYLILVRVHYSFISPGTETATLHATSESIVKKAMKNPVRSAFKFLGSIAQNGVQGTMALVKGKQIGELSNIGYSCAGQVLAVGHKVKKIRVGDYVACAGAGIANHADVVAVPENLAVKVTDKDFLKQTSLTTIGAIAMQGIRRADLRLGEKVCVLGLGLIGQLTVQLAKLSGCEVFAVDLQDDRIKLAKECGADFVYNGTQVDLKKEIDFATMHYGVDTTIITAASSSGVVIQQAMEVTRRKGRVILVGDAKLDFERNPFYAKEIDFLISCSYGPGRYDHEYEKLGQDYPFAYVRWTENRNMQLFVDLVEKGKLKVDPLISKEIDVLEAAQAYELLKQKTALGVVLAYDTSDIDEVIPEVGQHLAHQEQTHQRVVAKAYMPPEKDLNIAVVGVGGFTKGMLLPIISKLNNAKITSIIDIDNANASNTARTYNATKVGNSHKDVVYDSEVKAVIIATPHHYHTDQAIDCLSTGKAVFLEKPACVNFEQYEKLERYLATYPDSYFTVDFNRSWAPFNQSVKEVVKGRNSPLIVHYRMNSGYIPKSHWMQSDENRGRIIGEACHIFELFCFLTDAQPVSVSVESLQPKSDNLFSHDNVLAQIRFDDGSCCSLLYTAIGNTSLSKERMEVFFDGKSIVMDDYYELKGYGLPTSFNKKVMSQSKGHEELIAAFMNMAQGHTKTVPIPFKRILNASKLSLIVDELARSGGGYKPFNG